MPYVQSGYFAAGYMDAQIRKGRRVVDILMRVQNSPELRDKEFRDLSGGQMEGLFHDAVQEMADEGELFRRQEWIVPTAGRNTYELTAEVKRILRVEYDGEEIPFKTHAALDNWDSEWRTASGTPRYWTGARNVRLVPTPDVSGTAYVFLNDGNITPEAGHSLAGADYCQAHNLGNGENVFFVGGDSAVISNETAANNLKIDYLFFPSDADTITIVPARFVAAVQELMKAKALFGKPGAEVCRALYERHKDSLLSQLQSTDGVGHRSLVGEIL